ncbi:hypothetical protein [Methylocaldum szegediense]|uniref:Uncharacterized protein n=1 Tax=Methylocaldum szegediense TaxID=73780 RepID=A0ABM9I0S0_9GAMM|nr:hypothetical protein [Methylocaldum szegediense]CAI8814660.1 protein of unknown function [Methylocaldum szegediense]
MVRQRFVILVRRLSTDFLRAGEVLPGAAAAAELLALSEFRRWDPIGAPVGVTVRRGTFLIRNSSATPPDGTPAIG